MVSQSENKTLSFFEGIVTSFNKDWWNDDGKQVFIEHARLLYDHVTQDKDQIRVILQNLYQAVASEYGD